MSLDVPPRLPGWVRTVCSGILALGFLLLITHLFPQHSPSFGTRVTSTLRQRVVIFLVDTSDYFDAHGTYVQSVIKQYCPACDVRQVNLHGDVSIPAILQALRQVQEMSREVAATTTALLNLSLGTYTYDRVLHTVVRALDTQGVLVIASAGNDNTSKPFYPAAFKEVVGVCSSTRYSKTKAAYSNFGAWVSLCAPGLHYVTRPLQPGGLASGTSFASPMVAGVLGQLLLDAPCVKPRRGLQALLRTADVPADQTHHLLGAGLLNPKAAAHYLRMLYPCQASDGSLHRLLTWGRHIGTGLLAYVGLIVYFILSVFALPFLLAYVIDMQQRRMARRQQDAIHLAYTGSSTYRYQRLVALKQRWQRTQKLRWYHQAELVALLHAVYVHGEPCWWCDSREMTSTCAAPPTAEHTVCRRCGLTVSELLSLD